MGLLKKMKAKLEDLYGFLKENKSKIRGFPPIRGRMEIMILWKRSIKSNSPVQTDRVFLTASAPKYAAVPHVAWNKSKLH